MFLADMKMKTISFGLFLYLSIAMGMFDLGEIELLNWGFVFRGLLFMFFIFGFFEGMGFLFEDELGLVDIFEAGLLLAMGFVEVFGFGGWGRQGEIPAMGHMNNYILALYLFNENGLKCH